jgi:hypothetical protein
MVTALRYHTGYAHVYTLTVASDHDFFVGGAGVLVHNTQSCFVWHRDYATAATKNASYYFKSEGEARALARTKLGSNPVDGSLYGDPFKWRSRDGKWQYRAKPGDLAEHHIHLEELDPATGRVIQNYHLRW